MVEELQALSTGALVGASLAGVVSLFVIAKVIHFGYYFYIDHGFILVEGNNHRDKIKATLKKLGKVDSFFAIGYPFAALACVLCTIFFGFIGHFWYVFAPLSLAVSFILLPAIGIRLVAKDKRNKVVFVEKLDGTHNENI